MSLRKSRKRRAAGKAAKALTVYKLAQPVGGAIKSYTRARAGKGLAKRAPGRKPLAIVAGLFGAAGLAAVLRKRRGGDDLGYGPPNESHPSHETLAPSQAAAGQAGNGASGESGGSGDVAAGGPSSAPTGLSAEKESGAGSSSSGGSDAEGSESAGSASKPSASKSSAAKSSAAKSSGSKSSAAKPSDEAAGPAGDEAGTEDAAREERAETTG